MNFSYDPTNLDLLESLRAQQKDLHIASEKQKLEDSFRKSFPDISVKFHELVALDGSFRPRDGNTYYIHPTTFQTFAFSLVYGTWEDVTANGNWKRVYDTKSFLFV